MAADPLTKKTVDNLLLEDDDFDFDEDPFADKPTNIDRDDKATLSPRKRKADDNKENDGLGLDEEVKITKKRKPIAKLDVERLLSKPGIPKLREAVRSGQFSKKLRLKGKGHEFSDAGKLLNYYQLWLDNLYPRAKFADALQLVEKAGHQKRMQIMRRAWIDEGKPGYARDKALMEEAAQQEKEAIAQANAQNTNGHAEVTLADQDKPVDDEEFDDKAMFFTEGGRVQAHNRDEGPDEDELDALLAEQDNFTANNTGAQTTNQTDSEGEDDLDALLAEQDFRSKPTAPKVSAEDEEDELDALLRAEESIQPAVVDVPQEQKTSSTGERDQNDDEDSLVPLLEQQEDIPEPELPNLSSTSVKSIEPRSNEKTLPSEEVPDLVNTISSSPIPNVQTDDLDQLMDEHEAARKNGGGDEVEEHFLSSSPIPNTESQ